MDKATTQTVLAIETATSACSVALRVNRQLYERQQVGNNIHSQVVLQMVQSVMDQAKIKPKQLTAIAVGQGPGSFTGLRIGIGVAQGIAYAAGCPMIGVSSLDALALQSTDDGRVIAGIDARMGEIYWCEYAKNSNKVERLCDLQVTSPELVKVSSTSDEIILIGNAWLEYADKLDEALRAEVLDFGETVYPSAVAILSLAESKVIAKEWVSATDFVPEYVRNDVAKKSNKNPRVVVRKN